MSKPSAFTYPVPGLFVTYISPGAGSHILWLGEVRRSFPYFVNLSCALVGLVLVPLMCFCFVGLPFLTSASWPLFPVSLPLFFPLPPTLLESWARGRAFVLQHTFLHSWSESMTLVVYLLHGTTFLSDLTVLMHPRFPGMHIAIYS